MPQRNKLMLTFELPWDGEGKGSASTADATGHLLCQELNTGAPWFGRYRDRLHQWRGLIILMTSRPLRISCRASVAAAEVTATACSASSWRRKNRARLFFMDFSTDCNCELSSSFDFNAGAVFIRWGPRPVHVSRLLQCWLHLSCFWTWSMFAKLTVSDWRRGCECVTLSMKSFNPSFSLDVSCPVFNHSECRRWQRALLCVTNGFPWPERLQHCCKSGGIRGIKLNQLVW